MEAILEQRLAVPLSAVRHAAAVVGAWFLQDGMEWNRAGHRGLGPAFGPDLVSECCGLARKRWSRRVAAVVPDRLLVLPDPHSPRGDARNPAFSPWARVDWAAGRLPPQFARTPGSGQRACCR